MKYKERKRAYTDVDDTLARLQAKPKHQHTLVFRYDDDETAYIATGLSEHAHHDVFCRVRDTQPSQATLDVRVVWDDLKKSERKPLAGSRTHQHHTFGSVTLDRIVHQAPGKPEWYTKDAMHRAQSHAMLAALISPMPTYTVVEPSGHILVLTGVAKAYVEEKYADATFIVSYSEHRGAIWERHLIPHDESRA